MHGRRDPWKMEFGVVDRRQQRQHNNYLPVAPRVCTEPRCLHAMLHCKRAVYLRCRLVVRLPSWSVTQRIVCGDICLQTQPLGHICSPRIPAHKTCLLLTHSSSASSPEISLKIAARSFPHLTLSPSSTARSKHFTHLPETIPS